ncbi:MAG TPA: hypothetical protein VF154_00320, partial [Terriglobales bacterium]
MPAVSHGVARVGGQVHHNLLHLHRVRLDGPQLLAQLQRELNVFPDQAGKGLANVLQHMVEVEHTQNLHLLAAEGEQLAGKVGGPPRRLENFFSVVTQGRIRSEGVHHQLGIAADHHEQVIEVVGHAPRQLADGIHLLYLRQLLFQ